MLKKYFPLIVLIAAGGLYFYIKNHQRGRVKPVPVIEDTRTKKQENVNPPNPAEDPVREEGFNRRTSRLIYSKHARCRMACRQIDESEVKEILEKGTINYNKIEEGPRGKSYPLEGVTHDNQRVRIVFAPKDDGLVVVTCIDLDRDWVCDCK